MINIKRRSLLVGFCAAGAGQFWVEVVLLNEHRIDGLKLPRHQI